MKTAISIPDPLFQRAEKLAQRMGVSRSELFSKAVSEYIQEHKSAGVTEQLNAIYGEVDSELEAELYALQASSLSVDEW